MEVEDRFCVYNVGVKVHWDRDNCNLNSLSNIRGWRRFFETTVCVPQRDIASTKERFLPI